MTWYVVAIVPLVCCMKHHSTASLSIPVSLLPFVAYIRSRVAATHFLASTILHVQWKSYTLRVIHVIMYVFVFVLLLVNNRTQHEL